MYTVKKICSLHSEYTWAVVSPDGTVYDVCEDRSDAVQMARCLNM
jgi:hypothetical protein